MKAFVEGYGCSLNQSDTEQVRGFLLQNNFNLVEKPEKAGLLVLNTCAVKEQTEYKMLARAKQLNEIAEKKGSTLVVFGCLPKINSKAIVEISPKIVQIGPSLEKLASFLELPLQEFSPELEEKRQSSVVSIIPISRGCLGYCTYCATKNARGRLQSYGIKQLNEKFRKAIKESKEIWLTAQDCGCYGFDNGTNLAELLSVLLRNKGNYRVRIGMSNPKHLKEFLPKYLKLFEDKRLYRFFHLPAQSGSNEILERMNRGYSRQDFLRIAKAIRSKYPSAAIALDLIVGFPGETEKQFGESLALVQEIEPDVVNISRFGARPNTLAEMMKGQLHGRVKKERSRKLTTLCKEIALKRNKSFVGERMDILVNEKGKGSSFVGRNQNYKPVALKKAGLGNFVRVEVEAAFPTYLRANFD